MASKLAVTASQSTSNETQSCWICFSTKEEDLLAEWVQPCICRGTVGWVHQQCLKRWIDEKQKGNSFRPVECPHCLTEYIIIFPRMGILVTVLHEISELLTVFCPFLVAGIAVVILYWTSVTYGAITVIQVMGYDDGIRLLERTEPLALVVGLPSIPVSLISSQFFRWDDLLLKCFSNRTQIEDSASHLHDISTPVSGARILCSALLLPTVSVIVGRAFKSIESNLLKTLLGGISFIVVKGTIKIILQHSEFVRKRHKKVVDYTESNLMEFENNRARTLSFDSGSSVLGSNASMELLVVENLMHV